MLPLQITLTNFMSYGEEPTMLDLRGMDVVCLSGDNGHGKSTIIEAITYALWGETRLGKQGHEQLIRIGADEMAVVLDFQLGEHEYRVRRQRSRKSGGQIWEIQALETDGTLRPLTGVGTADTGRVISRLLRMNYDTFLNSAYLKQGRADEFVRQPPGRRKDILAEILDLSRYDELEALARLKAKDAQDRKTDAERALREIETVAASAPQVRSQLDENTAAIGALEQRNAEIGQAIENVSLRLALIETKRMQATEAKVRINAIESQIADHQKAVESDNKLINEYDELLSHEIQINSDYEQLIKSQTLAEKLTQDCQTLTELNVKKASLDQMLASQRRELEREISRIETEIANLQSQLTQIPALEAEIKNGTVISSEIALSKTRLSELAQTRDTAAISKSDLKSRHDRVKEKLDIIEERTQQLSRQGSACSVCGNPLSDEQIIRLSEQCETERVNLNAESVDIRRRATEINAQVTQLEAEIKAVQTRIDAAEQSIRALSGSQHRLADLVKLRDETLVVLQAKTLELTSHLASAEFAKLERQQLAETSILIAPLVNAPGELRQIQAEIKNLQPVIERRSRLQQAQRDQEMANIRVVLAYKLIQSLTDEQDGLVKTTSENVEIEADAKRLSTNLIQLRTQQSQLSNELRGAQSLSGSLRNQLDQIAKSQAQREMRSAQLLAAQREMATFTELAGAFGKRGVQAMIIDSAMPELEADASDLLQRLTDGSMSLSVQTQRASKSKTTADGLVETLDIIVRDDLGERDLSLYSGGESFRVSFALRIALSKLLARRAGADLQSLIIDEGFGSQDASGREKLVDAIMAIRGDFAQILVITHVDELKEAFPNRIEVVKTPTGSQASLITGAALG